MDDTFYLRLFGSDLFLKVVVVDDKSSRGN